MRHRKGGYKLGRNTSHRRALLRNLVTSIVVEDKVETTLVKAIMGLLRPSAGRVRYTDHIIGKGEELFRELEKQELEGMVAKRLDSIYVGGRTRAWLKIKTSAGREEMRKRGETWKR